MRRYRWDVFIFFLGGFWLVYRMVWRLLSGGFWCRFCDGNRRRKLFAGTAIQRAEIRVADGVPFIGQLFREGLLSDPGELAGLVAGHP